MFIYSGAFHYFRCPKELWRARFQKIKDAGFNTVETYVPWNWSEPEMPGSPQDYSKVHLQDLDDWLTMAEEFGFYVIVRPGPYIGSEWDRGGFPDWLMTKKPAGFADHPTWLRSDDPAFLEWCRHWYAAVCPIIAKHQITHKPAGSPGVILFQFENEYNTPKFPVDVMLGQLRVLYETATEHGIDVPFFTCYTDRIIGQKEAFVRCIFDANNCYPGWGVEKNMNERIVPLHLKQPDAPVMVSELQGGWFSTPYGKASDKMGDLTAAQIQNVALYAIQSGATITNFYMLFGGTNFDDHAAQNITTTYDYNAPIRENGTIGERYRRVWAIGHMLKEYGAKLARAEAVPCQIEGAGNKEVEVAIRRAQDGSEFVFVRTNQHKQACSGSVQVREMEGAGRELAFDYSLEPFGSKILFLPPGAGDAQAGQWLPEEAPEMTRPAGDLPGAIDIETALRKADVVPRAWKSLAPNEDLEDAGILGSHFVYYRLTNKSGTALDVTLPAKDKITASGDGKLLDVEDQNGTVVFPGNVKELLMVYQNFGHPQVGYIDETSGIRAGTLPMEAAGGERERGIGYSQAGLDEAGWAPVSLGGQAAPLENVLLSWYRMKFELPAASTGVWMPWHLYLDATGDGFIYLNGHCIGRYWRGGTQHNYFLPDCWMDPAKTNVITVDLRTEGQQGGVINAAKIVPDVGFAD